MSVDIFAGFYPALDSLSEQHKQSISGLIFSHRQGEDTVAVIVKDRNAFDSIALGYTSGIDSNAKKYIVDLESLGTDKVRLYADYNERGIELVGFYVNATGEVYEKKIYNNVSQTELSIDRYDIHGNLISSQEPEYVTEEENWAGPKELVSLAQGANLTYWFLRKGLKDQNYMVVFLGTQNV